jgi:hypothetical protein
MTLFGLVVISDTVFGFLKHDQFKLRWNSDSTLLRDIENLINIFPFLLEVDWIDKLLLKEQVNLCKTSKFGNLLLYQFLRHKFNEWISLLF